MSLKRNKATMECPIIYNKLTYGVTRVGNVVVAWHPKGSTTRSNDYPKMMRTAYNATYGSGINPNHLQTFIEATHRLIKDCEGILPQTACLEVKRALIDLKELEK